MDQINEPNRCYLNAAFMPANFDHLWQIVQQVYILLMGNGCCWA